MAHFETAVRDVLGTSRPSRHERPPSSQPPRNYHYRPDTPPPPAVPTGANAPIIVWFRGHDLRVHDHAALDTAVATGAPIIALFVLEPGAETDGLGTTKHLYARPTMPRYGAESLSSQPSLERCQSPSETFALGRVQLWWIHHSLTVFRDELARIGITLVLRRVDCASDTAEHVISIARKTGASAVFWNKRYKPRAYPLESAVRDGLRENGIIASDFASETLIEPNEANWARFDDFQSYTRFWIDSLRENPPSRPRPRILREHVRAVGRPALERRLSTPNHQDVVQCGETVPNQPSNPLLSVEDLRLLDGICVEGPDSPGDSAEVGCLAARRTLDAFLRNEQFTRFSSGAARRDGMVVQEHLATSRLSPHVRFGEISPRVLFYAVVDAGAKARSEGNNTALAAARTFVKNMSLREFGYYMLCRYPQAASKPIMAEFEVFPWVEDEDGSMLRAWKSGTTGFPIVDAAMRQLNREGWIHNRMRFLAASFFCKYLLLPWPLGADHMFKTLVDGDEACNSLGWQWTAGCNSDSFPFSTLVNPLALQNHSQSKKRAAAYVRKYVPELADLPDSLVFTPWKATPWECKMYNITLISQSEYRSLRGRWNPSKTVPNSLYGVYPTRIVKGPDARIRARKAMEVMRRIFAAQRQCRTLVVDQTIPLEGGSVQDVIEKRFKCATLSISDVIGKQILDDMSVVTVSNASSVERPKSARRWEDTRQDAPHSPAKRQKLTSSQKALALTDTALQHGAMSVAYLSGSSEISRGEVDLLLSSSMPSPKPTPRRSRAKVRDRSPVLSSPVSGCTVGGSESTLKRPRSSLHQDGRLGDERVSVQALLTSNQPSTNVEPRQVVSQSRNAWGEERGAGQSSRQPKPDGTPSLAINHAPSFRSRDGGGLDQMGNMQSPVLANTRSSGHSSFSKGPNVHRGADSPSLVLPPVTTSFRSPQINPQVGPQTTGFRGVPPISQLRQGSVERVPKSNPVPTVSHVGRANMVPGAQHPVVGMQHPAHKGLIVPAPIPFDTNRMVSNGMYHQGMQPLPVMQDHFQQHPPGQQMIVPFRNHGATGMGHQPGAVHSTDGTAQRFFQMPPVSPHNPHGPRPPGQPIVWYPAMSPYVDFRMQPGMSSPHMLSQMVQQHPGHLPAGYGQPGGSSSQGPGMVRVGVANPNGNQGQMVDPSSSRKPGPANPMEREAIARRMAAMDYYDDAYGGKHWEQWQAIALHLLDQYEFSEDTDRETSKAYVRLCVLKDELRDANPQGPRVTVNHCKEVFRILRLPVTGEWDRRGHGGVRGPYCYGCVKRSGVQISKK